MRGFARAAAIALLLLASGYVAGTLAPHATADSGIRSIATDLHEIRREIESIRRIMERQR